jgi:hypothetical protein
MNVRLAARPNVIVSAAKDLPQDRSGTVAQILRCAQNDVARFQARIGKRDSRI